jgi:gas vesicle protein
MRIGSYESSESSNVGTALTFFMIGLGAGALAGLLLAPKTGKQMRRDLKRGYEDAREAVGDWTDEAKDSIREAGERVRDVAQRGADIAEEIREKVEPLRRVINRGEWLAASEWSVARVDRLSVRREVHLDSLPVR